MEAQFCARVGENIRKFRKENDLTLKEVASMVGVTEATVQKYECGYIKNINVEMLDKFSNALGVYPWDLVGWKNSDSNYPQNEYGRQEAQVVKKYSQLTHGHKKAVQGLIENLLECQSQEKYSSDK